MIVNLNLEKSHSITPVVMTFVEKYAAGVFLDLNKAFDTINHNIFLQKLYTFVIRGPHMYQPKLNVV